MCAAERTGGDDAAGGSGAVLTSSSSPSGAISVGSMPSFKVGDGAIAMVLHFRLNNVFHSDEMMVSHCETIISSR